MKKPRIALGLLLSWFGFNPWLQPYSLAGKNCCTSGANGLALARVSTHALLKPVNRAGAEPNKLCRFHNANPTRKHGPSTVKSFALDRRTLEAIRYLESAVTTQTNLEGLILRYGSFSGQAIGEHGSMVNDIRKRRTPLLAAAPVFGRSRPWQPCEERARWITPSSS
jgi:hypothetical protein